MDSITQMVLGAAVGEATLGRKVGRRASLWGAICGTLPDLDSFVPFQDAVAAVTYHRSASHSLLVLALVTPLVVWIISKCHPQTVSYKKGWLLLVYLVFATHALLDALTVYGTQLLWPLTEYPVSWSVIFIIDPLYSLPLLVGVLCALCFSRTNPLGLRMNLIGLVLSSLYLGWAVTAKFWVENRVHTALATQQIESSQVLTTPAPFNTLLWRTVVMVDGGYYEGWHSVLDESSAIAFKFYHSDTVWLENIEDHWPVKRLRWFTHGFYSVKSEAGSVVMTDLRMGMEPAFPFRYKVATIGNPHTVPVQATRIPLAPDMRKAQLPWVWWRLTHPVKAKAVPE